MFKYLKKSISLLIMGAIFAAGGTFMVVMLVAEIVEDNQFSKTGRVSIGTVQAKRIETENTKQGVSYFFIVSYVFNPPTMSTQSGEDNVEEAIYDTLKPGDEIEVEYLAQDPTRHRLAPEAWGWLIYLLVLFASLFILIGLLLLVPAIRRAARQSRLWDQGSAHKARVVDMPCINPQKEYKDRQYQIVYEYEAPGGAMLRGKSQFHSRGWFGRVAEGDEIDIVVNTKRPAESEWRRELEQ